MLIKNQNEDGDQEQTEINLEFAPNCDVETFRIIVESMYTGVVDGIEISNVTDVLEASHYMEVDLVTEACTGFMLHDLDLENCLQFWLSATLCGNEDVKAESIGLIGRHLETVSTSAEFLTLQSNTVEAILSDDKLQVVSEVRAYEAAMSWIKFDIDTRQQYLSSLLDTIRMPLLPVKYLVNVVGTEDMIEDNSDAMKKYSRALKSQLGDGKNEFKARHNFVHGIRGSFEKFTKKIKDPASSCQKGEEDFVVTALDKNASDDDIITDVNASDDIIGDGIVIPESSSFRSSLRRSVGGQNEDGTKIDRLSEFRDSFKKGVERLLNAETYNNINKRETGGFWKSVKIDEDEDEDEGGGVGEEAATGITNTASYEEEQFLADCNDENEVKNDTFDISKDADDEHELHVSLSLNEPLEDVPEGNEEDVSEGNSAADFDMDNLSLEPSPEKIDSNEHIHGEIFENRDDDDSDDSDDSLFGA